jgi:hypothetical protein
MRTDQTGLLAAGAFGAAFLVGRTVMGGGAGGGTEAPVTAATPGAEAIDPLLTDSATIEYPGVLEGVYPTLDQFGNPVSPPAGSGLGGGGVIDPIAYDGGLLGPPTYTGGTTTTYIRPVPVTGTTSTSTVSLWGSDVSAAVRAVDPPGTKVASAIRKTGWNYGTLINVGDLAAALKRAGHNYGSVVDPSDVQWLLAWAAKH